MCDMHQHGRAETWITPQTSERLTAKMVQLFPGDSVPEHTTGPGREEVLIVLYGTIIVTIAGRSIHYASGDALFIPENTPHAIRLPTHDPGPAQYAYVVTKRNSPGTPQAVPIKFREQTAELATV